ncbi:MAG: alpha/beta hydrolase [Anaerolineae bacterium]|jgi:pimeloyl-ACP methyl ester carboxylesterase|nr:alpha/beta hydrolase [Anaerolineae bacterium]
MTNTEPSNRNIIGDLGRIVAPEGIQESFKVPIGGVDQWVNTRGQDRANPLLFFIHGGPASPATPTLWMYQRPIEEVFTVVNWDQRGAGRTYLEADPEAVQDTLHIDQYVSDALELAELLLHRYAAPKAILMGHSWGTIIGVRAVLERPELFSAYIGIGQVINTRENERLSYDYAISEATRNGNTAALEELAAIAPYPGLTPITRERIIIARKWAQYYGGLSAFRHESQYYFNAPLLSPEYDDRAVAAIDQGSLLTLERILPEFLEVDLNPITAFPIPLFLFMGRHDYTTPSVLAEAWLQQVSAPYKQGIWFERSAHLIPFEEPGKLLLSLVQQVLPVAQAHKESL